MRTVCPFGTSDAMRAKVFLRLQTPILRTLRMLCAGFCCVTKRAMDKLPVLLLACCLLVSCSVPSTELTGFEAQSAVLIATPVPIAASPSLPAATPAPMPRGVARYRLCFTGDIMCHEAMFQAAYDAKTQTYSFDSQFPYIKPYLEMADLAIGNLEAPLGEETDVFRGFPSFNAPPSLMQAVANAGFGMVTFANNHTADAGRRGISRTMAMAEADGIYITGATDEAHTKRYAIIDLPDLRLAVLAYTPYVNENLRDVINFFDLKRIEADIKDARDEGAEIVIVCCHWGAEYQNEANDIQKNAAASLVALGVDAVIGHHPHVLQEIDLLTNEDGKSVPVAYSLGNFVANQPYRYRHAGLLLELTFLKDLDEGTTKLEHMRAMPTYCWREGWGDNRTYSVLPAAASKPEAMSDAQARKMNEAYADTLDLLNRCGIEEWRPLAQSNNTTKEE